MSDIEITKQEEEEGVSIGEIITILKSNFLYLLTKWRQIFIVFILGSIFGVLYSKTSKPKYTSSLSFVIEGSSQGGLASIANSFGIGGLGSAKSSVFNTENVIEMLKSKGLMEQALLNPVVEGENQSFAELYLNYSGLNKSLKSDPEIGIYKVSVDKNINSLNESERKVLNIIYNTITKKEISIENKNTDNSIITIDLKTENEKFAESFPKSLITVVSEYYIESKTRKARLNFENIKKQTDSVRNVLNGSISKVAVENDNTFLLNPAYNIKRVPHALNEISVQANIAILTELVKNLEISRMNLLNETPIIEIIDTPILPLEKIEVGLIGSIIKFSFLFTILISLYYIVKKYLKNQIQK
jgi:hypothetical protein